MADPTDGLNLADFRVSDILRAEAQLRSIVGANPTDVAGRVVRYLYEALRDGPDGGRALTLARLYRVRPYEMLDDETRGVADRLLTEAPRPGLRCLTLIATAGDELAWNIPAASRGHRAIPLPNPGIVARLPMVVQLLAQFGVALSAVVDPDPTMLLDLRKKSYNVFHVEEALGSPHVPAQRDFVIPFGVRSALGFGGTLPDGGLFAVVLFAKVRISRETADLFPVLALAVRRALLGRDDDHQAATE